jgi:hypothetical protein
MASEASKPVKPSTTPSKTATEPAVKPAAKPVKAVASKVSPKPAIAPAAKPKAMPVPKVAAKPAGAPQAAKDAKVKKPKMVRDSFTFPKDEYAVLDDLLKLRAAKLGSSGEKNRVAARRHQGTGRDGVTTQLPGNGLRAVPSLKTGRPAKRLAAALSARPASGSEQFRCLHRHHHGAAADGIALAVAQPPYGPFLDGAFTDALHSQQGG